ncbi:MAG: DUF3891 family protein [Rhodoferax sp.]|nr:DUF3891 family protein [Rhodoferax sp.]
MLKTNQDGKLWMVTQPDHSQIAGFIAAHWGNALFTRPGFFSEETVADPERLLCGRWFPSRSWRSTAESTSRN